MELENQIGQMAENVKSIKDDTTNAIADLKSDIKVTRDEFQNQIDGVLAAQKKAAKKEVKFIDELIIEKLDGRMDEMEKSMKSNGKFRIDLSEAKSMTLSASLTGDAQASYAPNASVLPSQAINFRDLIPTVRSTSGLYVFYKETATTNNIGAQTEGSNKGENSYALSEVKVVNDYIAGFSTFSKQMARSLPFLSTTLPRMLTRDFYKAENSAFFTTVSGAATGSTTTAETVDLKQLVDYIGNQKSANFVASFALVSPTQMGRLLKETITAGYYAGNGSVIVSPNGGITIWGVPVIAASWVTDDKVLILDNNFCERVEVEGLAIEFSYENASNFQQNMVTARIECYEDVNLMQPTSAIYADLGNV
jgi:HK97 family phage major capsid protein